MPWPHPRIIVHRGGGILAPENTLAGIAKASALGFSAVEFDVMLAADGVPILMHDETLERTTSGRGQAASLDSASLARLDAGSWFSPEYAGERVPSLVEAAELCRKLGLWANVEIKPAQGAEALTGATVAAMSAESWRDAPSLPVLSSFSEQALRAAHAQFALGMLVGRIPTDWRERLTSLDCASLHCDYRGLTAEQVVKVHEAGYALLCYTVNDERAARRLLAWGVDAIITDRLDLIGPDFAGAA